MTEPVFRRANRDDVPAIVRLLADDELGRGRERIEDPLPAAYGEAFDRIDALAPAAQLVIGQEAHDRGHIVPIRAPEDRLGQTRAITRQPLVPPKPKELDITVSIGLSIRWRTIGRSAKAGSRFSI